jgi:hypothetical protein
MGIEQIKFYGSISNKDWADITGPEFMNALKRCHWQEGTGTHFFKRIRKRGRTMGISTPGQLEREISLGYSAPGDLGKTLHWICNGDVCIVYNGATSTLITISHGKTPPRDDDHDDD